MSSCLNPILNGQIFILRRTFAEEIIVHTSTRKIGIPEKLEEHFLVWEKAGNFEPAGKVRNFPQNSGKGMKF